MSDHDVPTIRARRGRIRNAGVAPRLLVLVLVPVLGLLLFAASAVALRSDANAQAEEIRLDVDRIARLAEVRSALFQESVPTDSATTLRRLGISLANANFLFKTSVEEQLITTRRATDDAVTALNEPGVVSMADIAAVRAFADYPTETFSPGEAFLPIAQRLDGAIGSTLAHAQTRLPLVPGVSEVGEALRASQRTIEVIDATLTQMTALARSYLETGNDTSTTWTIATARAENAVAQGELERVAVTEIADAWRAVRDSDIARQFRETFDRMARGDMDRVSNPGSLERMNATTTNALEYEAALFRLMDTTIAAARRASGDVAADAAMDLRQSLLLPVPLVLVALGVSLVVARSISRPMSRLADHAARIGAGDLSAEPLQPQGPRELAVAFDAVNDLVANLKLLDAKSQALVDLDFDAPVLAEPLPGRLGQVLERSLTVVSGSIDERDKLQDRLLQQASQDALTGVLNRAAAADGLEQALLRSRRLSEGVAVLHLDLDDFKRVNDSHGQAAGDGVLVETARRLQQVTGGDALIARLGGDEFLVVVEGVTDPGEVDDLAHRIRAALGQPVEGVLATGGIGVSIGIAFAFEGTHQASDVLAWAEMAVHRAKQRAAGSIEIYDEGLQQQLRDQAEIEDALTAALPRDELFLQYQPVIDLATGRMSSVEALVRWQRPELGMQPPDSFIPVAERSDLIVDLDKWVMARAARQINEWAGQADMGDMHVAVNVSGRHLLSQTLFDHVVELLDATGIAPQQLVVEITETVLVNDLVAAAAQLEAVRGLGVRIALDDFGTGYTSITHLRQLPIDIIKIDRSFVSRLASEKDRTLLAMITDLGHHLGLTITAEGVETAEQYETLRQLGCDRAQGYLMSRPLPADALETWAREQDAVPVTWLRVGRSDQCRRSDHGPVTGRRCASRRPATDPAGRLSEPQECIQVATAMRQDKRHKPRRSLVPGNWAIATRLLILVLVPVLGLLLFAASAINLRATAAGQAEEIRQDVDRIAGFLALRSALFQERAPSETLVAVTRMGLPVEVASGVFDMDLRQEVTDSRAATDAAVAALGDDRVVSRTDVAALRSAIDAIPHTESGLLTEFFEPPESRLDEAVKAGLTRARSRMRMVAGVDQVEDALSGTQHTLDLIESSINQMLAVDAAFLRPVDSSHLIRNVASELARSDIAREHLDDIQVAGVADTWKAVNSSTAYREYYEALDRIVEGDVPSGGISPELARVASLARDGLAYEHDLFGQVRVAIAAARQAAEQVAADAAEDLRQSIVMPIPLALLAVIVSLVCARSINRPIKRLADHAATVGAGDLTVAPLGDRGPRDIIVAFRAIDDLVANLKLLDAKSQALADLDFDSPVLDEPLPGRLGQSLERSLTVLSGSIDERDRLQDRLLQQASQDALTGVLNRAAAADYLEQALLRARRLAEGVAVLHLDLDDFKRINDSHGQATGDRVLRQTATRLAAVAGDDSLIARLGGDEFLVVVEGVTDAGDMDDLAHRLRDALRDPVDGTAVTVGASVGISFSWDGTDAASDVLAWAEMAVHRAKQRAAGSIEIYDEGLQQQLRELAEIEDALTAALPRDELFLQYQPVIDLATGRMSSVEALVRWQRPDVGMQPPDSFIPTAERSDLIVELDRWVMKRAARQMNDWADRVDLADIQVAVNVSGRHLLSQTLYDHVVELLDTTGIAPQRLVVEITETVLVNDLVAAAAQLEAVRGLGVRIALDDFGTGYTSITHLRQLPIDIIKIDRSFVARLANDKDRTLLAMITDLGHHLGLTITAEGVETAEQYEMLRQLGCDRAQGYLMSRPLPADALETWAREQDRAAAPS